MPNTTTATAPRRGDWMETYTGKRFYPTDPRPEDVDIADIAHALSLICRFNGHVSHHYSVAQHSVHCAQLAVKMGFNPEMQFLALMHDAAEAYVCDLPRPLKYSMMGAYAPIEGAVETAIHQRFEIQPFSCWQHTTIKKLDDTVLYCEARQLLSKAEWVPEGTGYSIEIPKWTPEFAELCFIANFTRLEPLRGRKV